MAEQQLIGDIGRPAVDRTRSGQRGGSIGLVLLIALVLVGAAAGLLFVGRSNAEPYILALLAVLAMVGIFLLFALATGILRATGRETASPLIKAVVDGAGAADVRPVERAFIGDPGVSEAVYRLLKAAREGRRLEEEVRVGSRKG